MANGPGVMDRGPDKAREIRSLWDKISRLTDAPNNPGNEVFEAIANWLNKQTKEIWDEAYQQGHQDGYSKGHDEGYEDAEEVYQGMSESKRKALRKIIDEASTRNAPEEPWARVSPDRMNRKVHITLVGSGKKHADTLEKMKKTWDNVHQVKGARGSEMLIEIRDQENPSWKADEIERWLSREGYNIAGSTAGQKDLF